MKPQFVSQKDEPMYPDILWNRPTNIGRAGRLLILGGHKNEFSQIQHIFEIAEASGIGEIKAAMPDSLKRLIPGVDAGFFLPSTNSGSIARSALGEIMNIISNFDAVVIGANITNNSETAILIESIVRQSDLPIIITEEAISILKFNPDLITGNPNILVVSTMPGIFELANNHNIPLAIRRDSGLLGKLQILDQLVSISRCQYFVFDQEVLVAADNKFCVTRLENSFSHDSYAAIGIASAFWVQNRNKAFESLTTAAYILRTISQNPYNGPTDLSKRIRTKLLELEG